MNIVDCFGVTLFGVDMIINGMLDKISFVASGNRCYLFCRLKTLQAQLAEKDAMLKVLQRHSSLSRTSSVSSLFASPLHSPRTSLMSSPLALSLCSSALSTPGASASSSRQNSQIDTSPYCREAAKPPIHSKSSKYIFPENDHSRF